MARLFTQRNAHKWKNAWKAEITDLVWPRTHNCSYCDIWHHREKKSSLVAYHQKWSLSDGKWTRNKIRAENASRPWNLNKKMKKFFTWNILCSWRDKRIFVSLMQRWRTWNDENDNGDLNLESSGHGSRKKERKKRNGNLIRVLNFKFTFKSKQFIIFALLKPFKRFRFSFLLISLNYFFRSLSINHTCAH